MATSDSSPIYTKTSVNMERNGKKFALYWLFLRDYCSPLKSINGPKDTYTLKSFNQAGPVATTRWTTCLTPRSSSDASECSRTSRHITLTAMLNSGQILGMSKTSQNYRNIRLLVGAWDTPSSPSTPIGPIISKPFCVRKFWLSHFSWLSYLPRSDQEFLYLWVILLDRSSRLSHIPQSFRNSLSTLSDIIGLVCLRV